MSLPLTLLFPPIFPEAASSTAHRVDQLTFFLVAVCGAVTFVVFFLMIYWSVKYRYTSRIPRTGARPGFFWLEMTWTVLPLLIFLGFFFWGARIYFDENTPPDGAMNIYVVGKQWMWKFQHPEGRREINQLHVPLGQPVKLTMISEDVIHDVFIPAFRVKQDVLPFNYRTEWFEPTELGRFHLFCAEYCGTNHSLMGGDVIVMEPQDYEKWVRGEVVESGGSIVPVSSMSESGAKLYRVHACYSCHGDSGEGTEKGPPLSGLFGRTVVLQNGQTLVADETYVRDSILHSTAQVVAGYQPIMPVFEGAMSELDVAELIEFIRSLNEPRSGSGGQTTRAQEEPVTGPITPRPIGQAETNGQEATNGRNPR